MPQNGDMNEVKIQNKEIDSTIDLHNSLTLGEIEVCLASSLWSIYGYISDSAGALHSPHCTDKAIRFLFVSHVFKT